MSGRIHFYKTCGNTDCPSKRDKSLGNIWGDPMHDIARICGREISTCTICGHEEGFRDPDSVSKTRYPYYNSSTDTVFESKTHETNFVKANKLDVV